MLDKNIGLLLIKPDAIKLGIEEYVIGEFCQRLQGKAELDYVQKKVLRSRSQINLIYPEMIGTNIYRYLENNLLHQTILVASFVGNREIDMWSEMSKIKGLTPKRWTLPMLDGNTQPDFIVRGWLPIPGSSDVWISIFDKLKNKIEFNEQEYFIYCQNLIHTPDTTKEFEGLMSFFPKKTILIPARV